MNHNNRPSVPTRIDSPKLFKKNKLQRLAHPTMQNKIEGKWRQDERRMKEKKTYQGTQIPTLG
jgi:hypothetical protein